ncbi:hypothetical protein [Mycobacterium shottsii]|uniref:hypothetical protein n=1 Tax=Mycobacterium shottsii TaxID=133549 RepID=UPI0018E9AEFD|nr:hypothetical protein [Mycobacterium shottsii]
MSPWPPSSPTTASAISRQDLGANSPAHTTKTKRTQQDDRALYTEQRPWTEALIGPARPHLTTTTTTEHKP